MNKLALLAGSLLLAILGVTGCGGGGTEEGSRATAPGGLPGGVLQEVLPTDTLNYGDVIFLKSSYFRQYASARDGGSVAQALHPLQWERWTVLPPDGKKPATPTPVKYNDRVVLQSSWSTYLSAQQGDRLEHVASPQSWEVWQFQDQKDSASVATMKPAATVLLASAAWNTHLSARQGAGAAHVSATNTWEHWNMTRDGYVRPASGTEIHYGDVITARSSFRTYLSAQQGSSVELADHPEGWEKWEVVNPDDWGSTDALHFKGAVTLYSVDKGTFLSAQNNWYAEQAAQALGWEEWTIIDPTNQESTNPIKPLDVAALYSSWNTWLSAQQTVARHVAALGPWEQWIVAPDGYFANWMAWEAAGDAKFASKPLREITFPASHDAGTWSLKSEISNDTTPIATYIKPLLDTYNTVMNSFLGSISKVTIAGYTIDLGAGLVNVLALEGVNASYDTLKTQSQATRRTVAQQLSDGVRWLDLRIDLRKGDGAYTYHFLTGVEMAGVLDDVAAFLKNTKGEIVVLEMSHFTGDERSVGKYNDFADMVDQKLEGYMVQWTDNKPSPLASTYAELAGTGTRKSRAIVIMDSWGTTSDAPNVHDRGYWRYGDLGIDTSSGTKTGSYANMSNLDDMVADQKHRFLNRDTANPFVLFMTLTGSPSELGERWLSGTAARWIEHVIDNIQGILFGPVTLVDGVHTLIRNLVTNTMNWAFGQSGLSVPGFGDWNSLWDLSQKVDPQMHTILHESFQSTTDMSTPNAISVIYADFMDTTFLVETAIRYSRKTKNENNSAQNSQ